MPGNGSSGRRGLPAEIAKLHGRRHRKRTTTEQVIVDPAEPAMPEHLSPAAREEWRRVVPALLKLGVLAAMDQGALSSYCTAHSVALEAEAAIAAGGVIVEEIVYNREGDEVGRRTKPNPACKVLSDMLRLKKAYGIEFGLTSASRTRLHIEKPKEPDEFDLYLAGVKERRSRPIPQDDEPEMDPQFPPQ